MKSPDDLMLEAAREIEGLRKALAEWEEYSKIARCNAEVSSYGKADP